MHNNLLALYSGIPEDVRTSGIMWYHDVRLWCQYQAERFEVTPEQVAGVIAATSPRMSWDKNLSLARQVLAIWAGHGTLGDCLNLPALKRSLQYAWWILEGRPSVLKGPKTTAFCSNISDRNSTAITVDVWAVRAAQLDYTYPYSDITKRYEEYEAAYQAGASVVGLRGYEFQAVVWIWIRYCAHSQVNVTQLPLL